MPDQRELALARANQIRSERREIKEKLASRALMLDDVLAWSTPPGCLHTMEVVELISAAAGFGQTKARTALRRLGHPEHRTFGGLTKEQKKRLLDFLAKHNRRALYGAAWWEYV